MIFGCIRTIGPVGWIAGPASAITVLPNGGNSALFGSVSYCFLELESLLPFAPSALRSRRNARVHFAWAFLSNLVIGGAAVWAALVLRSERPEGLIWARAV